MIALQHRHKAAEGRLEMRDGDAVMAPTLRPYWLRDRLGLFTIAGLAILISLGVWQLQRKDWKEGADRHARSRR